MRVAVGLCDPRDSDGWSCRCCVLIDEIAQLSRELEEREYVSFVEIWAARKWSRGVMFRGLHGCGSDEARVLVVLVQRWWRIGA